MLLILGKTSVMEKIFSGIYVIKGGETSIR